MVKLDGVAVEVGDAVFDLAHGAGKVDQLMEGDLISVFFQTLRRPMVYDNNGVCVRYTNRTLYWAAPYIVPVPKGGGKYSVFREVATAAAKAILA